MPTMIRALIHLKLKNSRMTEVRNAKFNFVYLNKETRCNKYNDKQQGRNPCLYRQCEPPWIGLIVF
jgi:hypothetical protein